VAPSADLPDQLTRTIRSPAVTDVLANVTGVALLRATTASWYEAPAGTPLIAQLVPVVVQRNPPGSNVAS